MIEVSKLTMEEKALLTSGKGPWHTHSLENIPSIMMTDGPHGLRKQDDNADGINDSVKATCFPTACAVASSWNVNNAAKVAQCIANEAKAQGVSLVLGPGLNIKRSPLCGRNFEYFSEDPLLAGKMTAAYVSSMQGNGVGSCVKHFAVNSQETRRMTVDAIVDERALREIYLRAFEIAIKESSPYAVMASYNKVNGHFATENKHLLGDILRGEWCYDGVIMSDWGASYNTPAAIAAGMDLEMPEEPSGIHRKAVVQAVQDGQLSEDSLNKACERIVKLVEKCNPPEDNAVADFTLHHSVCREVAADSAVLLKNEGILPLSIHSDFCVIGELACKPRYQGAGSSHINSAGNCVDFLSVLNENRISTEYTAGYKVDIDRCDEALVREAVALAQRHDKVLFFGGLTDVAEGEGYDRHTLEIPANQQKLLQEISKVNSNIIFVAVGGAPFEMPWLGQVKALLNMYLCGQAVTQATFDLLFGKVSPSGRLAETFPLHLSDTPCFNYFANDVHFDEHRESIFVGYRYYNTFGVPVQFPFGYGLSYSRFEYSNLQVMRNGSAFDVDVTLKNIGNFDASEVVQLYVDNCACGIMRAKRELRAFCKVHLKVGESTTVHFTLDDSAFSAFLGKFTVINGTYGISVCKNVQETLLSTQVCVDFGVDVVANDKVDFPDYFAQYNGTFAISDDCFYKLVGGKPQVTTCNRGSFTLLNTLEDMERKVWLVRVVLKFAKKMAIKQSPTKCADDPVAKMVYYGAKETPLVSLMSVGGIKPKYIYFILHHANKQHVKAIKSIFKKY